jgi:hypothetical protein
MDSHPIKLTLEVEPGVEPISGRIQDSDGRRSSGGPREFVGWLGLASALENLIGAAEHAPGSDQDLR